MMIRYPHISLVFLEVSEDPNRNIRILLKAKIKNMQVTMQDNVEIILEVRHQPCEWNIIPNTEMIKQTGMKQ